ncbi:MAG: glycosyltransferase, partial [Flavobacteriales bacterium]
MSDNTENWVFFSALPPFRGGIAKFSARTLKALRLTKKVAAFTFDKQYPDFLFPGSSQFDLSAPIDQIQRTGSTFNPFSYLPSGLRFRRARPKVFVTSYWMTFMAPMMICWAYLLPRRTKKIAIIHNLVPHEKRFFDRFFNRLFLHAYDAFVVLSEAVKNEVLALKPAAKITVLGHPAYEPEGLSLSSAEAKQQLGLAAHKRTILFFGLIRPYKGLLELIEAFALLDDDYQ